MAERGRFHIPSIVEMDKSTDEPPKVRRLFESHRPSISKDTTSHEPLRSATSAGSSTNQTTIKVAQPSKTSCPPVSSSASFSQPLDVTKPPCSTSFDIGGKPSPIQQPSTTNSPNKSSTDAGAAALTKTSNSLIVSTRQKGNPILKSVRNVPWEFGDIIPDYVLGQTSCALFLSLRYHALNPNYIHERLKQLGHSYELRVLLVQVDTKDPHFALKQLAKVCILTDCTLIVAWTPEEAGRYLETYKSYENKPPDLIMEKSESDFMSRVSDAVTTVKKVNKTDAMTLLSAFGSFQKAVEASQEDLSLCPGFGPQKAKRLHSVFHEPFVKAKKTTVSTETSSPVKVAASPRKRKLDPS